MSSTEYDYQAVSAFEISESKGVYRMEKGNVFRQYLVTIFGKWFSILINIHNIYPYTNIQY